MTKYKINLIEPKEVSFRDCGFGNPNDYNFNAELEALIVNLNNLNCISSCKQDGEINQDVSGGNKATVIIESEIQCPDDMFDPIFKCMKDVFSLSFCKIQYDGKNPIAIIE